MKRLIGLNDIGHKIPVGIEDCDNKPRPLGRSEQRNGILDSRKVGGIADSDKFSEQKEFNESHQATNVNVASSDRRGKDGKHEKARKTTSSDLFPF